MREYVLLVETGADTTKRQQEEYCIYTVPMHVFFGEECRDDGTFDPVEEFEFYKKTGIIPKSSGSNVEDYAKVMDRIHEEKPNAHILHIAYSAVTSVSYQSSVVASEGRDYITRVDTKQVSVGQAMVVEMVGRFLRSNPDAEPEDVVALVEDIRDRVHMGFLPGDLDYLRAGGRVSNAAYLGAKILSIKPVIEIKDGYLTGTKKYRGNMAKVSKRLLTEMVEEYNFSRDILYFVFAPGLDENIRRGSDTMAKDMGFKEIEWIMTGGMVASHSGPGGFGVIGISQK